MKCGLPAVVVVHGDDGGDDEWRIRSARHGWQTLLCHLQLGEHLRSCLNSCRLINRACPISPGRAASYYYVAYLMSSEDLVLVHEHPASQLVCSRRRREPSEPVAGV